MQKQKISLKRIALGVLVGVVALGSVASAGRAMQANMFDDLVAWLTGQNDYVECDAGYYWDGYSCMYDDYVDTYDPSQDCTLDCPWNGSYCECTVTTNYCSDQGGSYCDEYTESCSGYWTYSDDYGNSCCVGTCESATTTTDCGAGYYWDGYSCVVDDGTTNDWDQCLDGEYYDTATGLCEPADDTLDCSTYGTGCWEDCTQGTCFCNCDTSTDTTYCGDGYIWDDTTQTCEMDSSWVDCGAGYWYDGTSCVVEDGSNCSSMCPWDGNDCNCGTDDGCYDSYGNYTCGTADDDYHDSYESVTSCPSGETMECNDYGDCWCMMDEITEEYCASQGATLATDYYGYTYCEYSTYYEEDVYCGYGSYEMCDDYGCWCEFEDQYEDFYVDSCDSDWYYWEDSWGEDCYCEYGEEWFPDENGTCVNYGSDYWTCMDQGMMFDSYTGECMQDWYSYDDYGWDEGKDDYEWNWDEWAMEDEDEWEDWAWDGDDEWLDDELDNMGDMLQEASYWVDDIRDAKDEGMDRLEDVEWLCGEWGEDYEDDYDWLSDEQKDLYESAIVFCQTAKEKIDGLLDKFDDLEEDAEVAKDEMEETYEEFVDSDDKNPGDFWDAQEGGSVNDWRDVYRMQVDTWGSMVYFWEFKMEVLRIEQDTGLEAHELSDELVEQVAFAEYVLEEVESMLSSEIPALIADAEGAIEEGMDPWRAVDEIRDYYEDNVWELLDQERDMWDALDVLWDHAKDFEMMEFGKKELEYILADIEEAWTQITEYEADGIDMSEFAELLETAEEIIADLYEAFEEEADEDVIEGLFMDLEDVGYKADRLAEEYGIEFGPDMDEKKDMYLDTINVSNEDVLLDLLSQADDSVLEALLDMLLEKVTSSELDKFTEYAESFDDVGVFDSQAFGRADTDTLDKMIEEKLAILEDLEAKIDSLTAKVATLEDEILELSAEVAGYNWYGESAEEVLELQTEMEEVVEEMADEGASDDEIKEVLSDYLDEITELKEDAKEDKYEADLIPFKDCDDTEWFTGYVWDVKEDGIVSGATDAVTGDLTGEYYPSNNINLAELTKISLEFADVEVDEDGYTYNPHAQDFWGTDYWVVGEHLELDIVEDMTVDPGTYATRAEVLTTMFEAEGVEVPEYDEYHFEDSMDHEYADEMEFAYELGIVSGYGDSDSFMPDYNTNRAEVAKMVDNFMEVQDMAMEEDVEGAWTQLVEDGAWTQ